MNKTRLSYKEIAETITDRLDIYYKEHNCDFKTKNHFKKLNILNFLLILAQNLHTMKTSL